MTPSSKPGKLKFEIAVRRNDYDLKILCCGKPMQGRTTEYRSSEHRTAKCEKCGRRIKYDRFFQEAYTPTKEERKDPLRSERRPQEHKFSLEVIR